MSFLQRKSPGMSLKTYLSLGGKVSHSFGLTDWGGGSTGQEYVSEV